MLAVIWFDITRYIIPNWLVGSLLVLYPVAVMLAPGDADWKMAIVGMVVVFIAGYVLFAMRWMGGGDVKLITVCSLWVGWQSLLEFIFMFALIGGAFSLLLLVLRKMLPFIPRKNPDKPLPRILRNGEPVPYGVAIAIGLLLMMTMGKLTIASFY